MTSGVLTRYRVMAYVTGVLLLLLVFYAMPMKYAAHNDTPVAIIGTAHGWLYMVYLVTAFILASKLRWPLGRTILLLLAGTIPFASFIAERKVTHEARPMLSAHALSSSDSRT